MTKRRVVSAPDAPTRQEQFADPRLFAQDKERAQQMLTTAQSKGGRDELFKDIEEAYFMEPEDVSFIRKVTTDENDIKLTYSPDARNRLLGSVRLLIATDPEFSVPSDENSPSSQDVAGKLEKMAKIMFQASSKQRGYPLHYDAVLAGLMYGRMILSITDTEDMVAQATGGYPAAVERMRLLNARTPYFFSAKSPKNCYNEYDEELGLAAFYERKTVTYGSIYDRWGNDAIRVLGPDRPRHTETYQHDLYTLGRRSLWLDAASDPLISGEHGLKALPIVDQIVEGSLLFSKPHHQAQPWLYTLIKSGLWKRQSLALTVYYSLLYQLGNQPMMLAKLTDPQKDLVSKNSEFGKYLAVGLNESFGPMLKDVIDPALAQSLDLAERKGTESTMYPQALGEPIGGQAPYAMVALLHQAGRLPLISGQKLGGWALGTAAEIALRWVKAKGGSAKGSYAGISAELSASDIPDDFSIYAMLNIKLPQDRLQAGAVGKALTEGDNPLASNRWVQEEILGIGQPDSMQDEIWSERAGSMRAMTYFTEMMARLEQMQAQIAASMKARIAPPAPTAPPTVPPAPGEPAAMPQFAGGGGGQMTPEEQALAAQAGAAATRPVQGAVPGSISDEMVPG